MANWDLYKGIALLLAMALAVIGVELMLKKFVLLTPAILACLPPPL